MNKIYNHLLLKDDVGRSKPTTRDLPYEEFVYGKPEFRDPEGASDVASSWKFHRQSHVKGTDKDFKRLNKSAI